MKTQRASHHQGTHSWRMYPVEHVVGAIGNGASAREAIEALKEAGIQEQEIDLFDGRSLTRACLSHTRHTLLSHVANWLSAAFSDDVEYAREYLDEAAHNHDLIMVHVDEREQVELIRQVLAAHGAHLLRYYQLLTVTDL